MEKILRKFRLADGSKLSLVDVEKEYKICIDGEVQVDKLDYEKACKIFDNLVAYNS